VTGKAGDRLPMSIFRLCATLPTLSEQGLQGPSASTLNQNGSETRSEVQSHLSTQTVFAKKPIQAEGSAALEGS